MLFGTIKSKFLFISLLTSCLVIFLFQNATVLNERQVRGNVVTAEDSVVVHGLKLHKKWIQGIWRFNADPSLYLISQDPDGRDGHDHVYFHLVQVINGRAEVLVSKDLPAGTHAQSIYAEALDKYNYNIYTENADRRGISLFKLKFGKNLLNTQMHYEGDIYPKDAQGKSLFFHVFAVNQKSGLLVTGSLSANNLTVQRYDKQSFFKPIKKNSVIGESRAIPKYSPLIVRDVQSLQGIGLSESKAYVLRGSFALGSEDKNIYVIDFKTGLETNFILDDVWSKQYKAEPEGLFVQGKDLVFGLQGYTFDKKSVSEKRMEYRLFRLQLP